MRNPGGKGSSGTMASISARERRNRRTPEKIRLKPARSRGELLPWSPKESPSSPGRGPLKNWGWASEMALAGQEKILTFFVKEHIVFSL